MTWALLALLLVQVNFGLLPIAQKIVLARLTPIALLALRTFCAALIFEVVYLLRHRLGRHGIAPAPVTAKTYAWLALMGISLNQFLLIIALTMTGASTAVLVVPSIPMFTYVIAVCSGREAFDWGKAAILALGAVGILILFSDSLMVMWHGGGHQSLLGDILLLVSAAVYALYLVQSRDFIARVTPVEFTARLFNAAAGWTLLLMAAAYLLFRWQSPEAAGAAFFLLPQKADLPSVNLMCAMVSFIVIGPSVINYFLNLWALKLLPASSVSGFICLQTLIGATAAHTILGEEIPARYGIAALCIILSILLLSLVSLRRERKVALGEALVEPA